MSQWIAPVIRAGSKCNGYKINDANNKLSCALFSFVDPYHLFSTEYECCVKYETLKECDSHRKVLPKTVTVKIISPIGTIGTKNWLF